MQWLIKQVEGLEKWNISKQHNNIQMLIFICNVD